MDCGMALHKRFFFSILKMTWPFYCLPCSVWFLSVMWFCSSLVWTAAQDSPFTVSPSSCELGPLKSTSFRVTYDPKQLNTLHGAQLECFAYYKVMLLIYSKNSLFWINVSKNMSIWNSVEAYSFIFMQQILLPLCCLASLDAAGQSSHREATAVSTLVCYCQSHRPLLSARERAFHTMLLPEAPSSGETQDRERT